MSFEDFVDDLCGFLADDRAGPEGAPSAITLDQGLAYLEHDQ